MLISKILIFKKPRDLTTGHALPAAPQHDNINDRCVLWAGADSTRPGTSYLTLGPVPF